MLADEMSDLMILNVFRSIFVDSVKLTIEEVLLSLLVSVDTFLFLLCWECIVGGVLFAEAEVGGGGVSCDAYDDFDFASAVACDPC
jgi:hypothetical protein